MTTDFPYTGCKDEPIAHNYCDVAIIEILGAEASAKLAENLGTQGYALRGCAVRVVLRSHAHDTVPKRRRRAVDESTAEATLLLEDTTVLRPGWATALCDAFQNPLVAAVCGPVEISPELPPRYRALGRLEYGRFGSAAREHHLPGNAFAVRISDLLELFAPNEGIIEHELERRLVRSRRIVSYVSELKSVYAKVDEQGARLSTRFAHGRIYGSDRNGNKIVGAVKAGLAMPVLSLRALRAASAEGSPRKWIAEVPWILLMASAWALGEFTGQLAGPGNSNRSWN